MSINLDHIIIIVFLIITLFTGLKASKNIKDIAEYAIANKMFSSEILAITILATYITGAKGIGYTGYVFDDGILPILPTIFCGVIFCFIFIISFILPRIKYFDGCLTAAELMGQIYGTKARFTIGILGSFYNITLVTLQIIWIGNIGELLNIPKLYSIIFGGMFLVIYSAMGGIKSVTITDIIQFIAITVMIPIITYVVLNKIGGIESLIKQTPTQYFNILHHPHLKDYLIYCLWYIFPAFPLSFPFIQRMLIARSNKQLIKSYYISMFFLIIFFALLTLIGLSSIVLKETGVINPQIRGDQIITYLINNYFVSGVKGILAIGLIAAVMSTADSFLNSAGLLLAHDVIKLICDKRDIKVNELKLVRYITFGLGTIAILWALVNNVLPRIQYAGIVDIAKGINIASEIVALIFTIPLITGIMGLKGNPSSFFIPTIITAIFFIVAKLFFDNEFLVPITIFINVISFFISNYIINRGFIIVKRDNILRKSTSSHITNYLSNFCTLIKSFKSRIEYYDNSNIFALFIVFNYMLPLFIYSYAKADLYHLLLLFRIIGGLICMGLLLRHYWSLAIKQYFQYYYYFSLWYCLPFITTFTFLLEDKNPEWLINITCSIVLLIILVDWVMFIILSTTAILFAVTIYYLLVNNFIINVYSIYLLVYTCILSIIISIIFVRKKQQYLYTLINNQQALKKLYASTNDELIDALNYQEKIARSLGKEGLEILQQAQNITNNLCKEIMTDSSEIFTITYSKLTSIMKYLEEIANQAKNYIRLEVKIINLDHLLKEINDKVIKLDSAIVLTFLNKIPYKTLVCDVNLIEKLLINTIIQIKEYRVNTSNIQIYIDSTELWYRLDSIKNYTKKIPAIRFIITTLEDIGELPNFYMGDVTNAAFTLNNKQDLYQIKNIKIINAHYGALHSNEFNNEYSIIIVLPLNIRDVRPKTMDLKENDTVLQEVISDSLDIGTIESQLIQDINKKNQSIDITSFKKAIKLIKKYHAKQKRKSGEPFYLHPIAVTKILLQFTFDEDILLAALLHDVVEDTPMSLSKIEAIFNPTVAALVSGVTKFDQTKEKLKLSKYENILKLLEQEDTRVLMIKIADRIHNMRTLSYHESYEKQKIIAEETLQFYIPMANKLGLSKAVTELKHLVFQILNNLSTPSS